MPIRRENLIQHELIGLKAEVIEGSNPDLVGRKGVIVDETRNTITLSENEELKIIPKKEVTFSITLPQGEKVKVKGRKLVVRPENRVKKFR